MYPGESRRAVPSWPASEPPPPSNSACWIRADTTAPHRAAELRKLSRSPGSSRSSREPAQSCARRPWAKPPSARNPVCRPYGAPGVPAAVQAGPCRVPLDPGKAAHWPARAEIYPSCTHDGHGRAEPLTAQVKSAPRPGSAPRGDSRPAAPPVPEERMCVCRLRPIPWPPGTRTTTQARPRDATCGYRAP